MCKGRDFPVGDGREDVNRVWSDLIGDGRQGVLATVVAAAENGPVEVGDKLLVVADGRRIGTVGGGPLELEVVAAAEALLAAGGCRLLNWQPGPRDDECTGRVEIFLESLRQGYSFWILGAGHVGRAVMEMGRGLPFLFKVCDDRAESLAGLAGEGRVNTFCLPPDGLSPILEAAPDAALLIAGPSHDHDRVYLQAALAAEDRCQARFGFLGLLGSSRKINKLREKLSERPDWLSRLDSAQMPVGLELGDGSPHGIALAILAEAMAVLNGRDYIKDGKGRPLGLLLRRRRDR